MFLPVIALLGTGCYKTSETMDVGNDVVISYPARVDYNNVAGGLNYFSQALMEFDMTRDSSTATLSVNLPRAYQSAVTVGLGVDPAALDAYNADPVNDNNYVIMPEGYYRILDSEITIPAGSMSGKARVQFFPNKMDITSTGYILPVTITSASGANIRDDFKTIFFHVEQDPFPPYSTSAFKVVDFSSEEPAEAQWGGGGQVIHLFDNNNNTFWHSQWEAATPPPPHWFTIDMGTTQVIHGMSFLPRQGVGSNGRPRDLVIEVSTDNVTWTNAANIRIADNTSWQKFMFNNPTAPVRYYRITVNNMWGAASAVYTNLAEMKVM